MIRACLIAWFAFSAQLPEQIQVPSFNQSQPLEKSAYCAFVDREFIFTIEIVKPGVPLFNFVSMADEEHRLIAENIRLALGNRKSAVRVFAIETSEFQHPMSLVSLTMHPRSSFGFRLDGNFGNATEIFGANIRLGEEEFQLVPLTRFDFELLVKKVNRINLGSPDFSGDWRVLNLETLGSRSRTRR
jgi:hypothetical protein